MSINEFSWADEKSSIRGLPILMHFWLCQEFKKTFGGQKPENTDKSVQRQTAEVTTGGRVDHPVDANPPEADGA